MMQRLLSICAALFLLALAGCTSAPKPPTQLYIEARPACPLTPCVMPGRLMIVTNDDWVRSIDELEAALAICAAQVLDCIERQE